MQFLISQSGIKFCLRFYFCFSGFKIYSASFTVSNVNIYHDYIFVPWKYKTSYSLCEFCLTPPWTELQSHRAYQLSVEEKTDATRLLKPFRSRVSCLKTAVGSRHVRGTQICIVVPWLSGLISNLKWISVTISGMNLNMRTSNNHTVNLSNMQ